EEAGEGVGDGAHLEGLARLAVEGALLQGAPLTEPIRPRDIAPVPAVLAGLGPRDEPAPDVLEPEARLDGDTDDRTRLALPGRLVRGEDLRWRGEVVDAVRGRLDHADLLEGGLTGRLCPDRHGVPDRSR